MPDRDLGAQLRAYVDGAAPPVTAAEVADRPEGSETPVRRIGLALVLTAAVVAVAVVLVTRGDGVETVPAGSGSSVPTTAVPATEVGQPGSSVPETAAAGAGGSGASSPDATEAGSTAAPATVAPVVTDSIDVGGDVQGIVVADGSVWVAVSASPDQLVPPRLVQVDTARRQVVGSTEMFGTPMDLAAGGGVFWVAGNAGVLRVDPGAATCTSMNTGGLHYTGVVVAFGSVWAVAPTSVVRIDPTTGEVVAQINDVQGGFGIAAGAGSIWLAGATDRDHPVVTRIDPATNEVVAEIPVPSMTRRLVATDTAVYATVFAESPGGREGGVYQIDPMTNEYVGRVPGGAWVGITDVGGQPWVVSYGGHAVGIVSGGTIAPVDVSEAVGSSGDAIAFGDGAVWASSVDPGRLVRIDPGTGG